MRKNYKRSFDEIQNIVTDTERFFAQENIDESLRMKAIDNGIEVSLTDYDVERFDPTELKKVDVDAPLAERIPGGLGLYLVLKMADSINYEYHDRTSKITFKNRVTERDV